MFAALQMTVELNRCERNVHCAVKLTDVECSSVSLLNCVYLSICEQKSFRRKKNHFQLIHPKCKYRNGFAASIKLNKFMFQRNFVRDLCYLIGK